MGPTFTHPVPSPNCRELTIRDEINAVVETFAVRPVKEDTFKEPVLTVKALKKGGRIDVARTPATVDVNWEVEIYPRVAKLLTVEYSTVERPCVETKFKRLGEETNPDLWRPVVVEINDKLETYPEDPRPVTVDVKLL